VVAGVSADVIRAAVEAALKAAMSAQAGEADGSGI
jgi:hypothetical protein